MDQYKLFLSIFAAVVGLISYTPYLAGMLKHTVKPSAASWMVWGILTSVAFGAQLSAGGGIGCLITGISALFSFIVMGLAFCISKQKLTRIDWSCLLCALIALSLWILAKNPFLSVVLVSAVTLVGYIPTYYKSFAKPEQENATTYLLGAIKFAISAAALSTYSKATLLYPFMVITANIGLISLLALQRRKYSTYKAIDLKSLFSF